MIKNLIKKLSEAYGPSGEEDKVRDIILGEIKDYVDEVTVDSMGSAVAIKRSRKRGKGDGRKILFAAHMDEIGLVITHADEKGFLRIAPVGGVSPSQLVGQRFLLNGEIWGTVYHEKIKEIKELDWQKLYLDVGALSRDEVMKKVLVGSMAVFGQPFIALDSFYMGKAMDDRIGCAVIVEAIKSLGENVPNDLYFAFTVQEEVGLRGARSVAYEVDPSFAVAVDVTRAGDTPEAPLMDVSLGKGPAVKIMDSSMISHPAVRDLMCLTAEEKNIPYQREVLERGGTDAGAIHLSRSGVPSGVLSIPCRYVHSASEMVSIEDVNNAIKLLKELCLSESWNTIGGSL